MAQDLSLAQLEQDAKTLHGYDRLIVLNELSDRYHDLSPRKALRYARQATDLSENLYDNVTVTDSAAQHAHTESYWQLGRAYHKREDYILARDALEQARNLAITYALDDLRSQIDPLTQDIRERIARGEVKDNIFKKTANKIRIGEAVRETRKDVTIESQLSKARTHETNKEYAEAIEDYETAIEMLKDKGRDDRITEISASIASLEDSLSISSDVSKVIDSIQTEYIPPTILNPVVLDQADTAELATLEKSIAQSRNQQERLKDLSDKAIRENDAVSAINYFKEYQSLSQRIFQDSVRAAEIEKDRQRAIQTLEQEKKLTEYELLAARSEEEKQKRIKNIFTLLTGLVLGTLMVIFYFYRVKQKAYTQLEETKGQLESAEARIKKLLEQQVSSDVASALLAEGNLADGQASFAAIMFLDIAGFTPIAQEMDAKELIAYQNQVFGYIMDIIESHRGVVNQLLGDGFMASFGAPISHGNDAQHAYDAALEILRKLKELNQNSDIPPTEVRIGIQAGDIVTGNVGNENRKQFSVTGNAVITAARLEQLNKKYNSSLIITQAMHELLDDNSTDMSIVAESALLKGRSESLDILIYS